METNTAYIEKVDLSKFNNDWYSPGASIFKRGVWFLVNSIFFINPLNPFNSLKTGLLRAFGSKIGKGVVVKPNVNIKYPWKLTIGNNVWIGDGVWIGAKSIVCPGVTCGSHSILTVGSVATRDLESYFIYQGVPAEKKRKRIM